MMGTGWRQPNAKEALTAVQERIAQLREYLRVTHDDHTELEYYNAQQKEARLLKQIAEEEAE